MKVIFAGRLARDVETSVTAKGTAVAKFSVPDEVGFGDNKRTQWISASIFGKRAEGGLIKYLTKGQWVQITGQLELNTYTNREGKEKSNLQVLVDDINILWESKKTETDDTPQQEQQEQQDELDDDIPF